MSLLQRVSRSVNWNVASSASRSISTSRIVLSAETSSATTTSNTTKSTGLYQFFENGETLPKQNWTG